MRILVCYPWLDLGGAPNTSITLARGLKELGHEVYFFTKKGETEDERLAKAGMTCIYAPYDPVLPQLDHLNWKAYRVLCDALDRYSIDIIHAFHYHPYLLSLFAAPERNIPVMFTGVFFLTTGFLPVYPGRVIFVAEEFKDRASHLTHKHRREVLVMPNRVDLGQFYPGIDSAAFAREQNLPDSGWKIAVMSRVDSTKMGTFKYAVEAAEILASRGRDICLAVAGDGPLLGTLEKWSARVNRNSGRRVVRLLGAVKETPQLLAWSDIFMGIGRSAVEGMASGKPTLIVGENGLAGVVEPEKAARLQYHNFAGRNATSPVSPEHLADAVEGIMNDRGRYEHLASYARDYAMEHYDYHAGARRLEKIYEETLLERPLNARERRRLFLGTLTKGFCRQYILAWRLKLRSLLGRGG